MIRAVGRRLLTSIGKVERESLSKPRTFFRTIPLSKRSKSSPTRRPPPTNGTTLPICTTNGTTGFPITNGGGSPIPPVASLSEPKELIAIILTALHHRLTSILPADKVLVSKACGEEYKILKLISRATDESKAQAQVVLDA